MILPAIALRQPWAYAICQLKKKYENRNWPLPEKYVDKPVLIHASKTITKAPFVLLQGLGVTFPHGWPRTWGGNTPHMWPEYLPLGGIVGWAIFERPAKARPKSIWADPQSRHHWRVKKSGKLPFFPCRGKQGFFCVDYPYDVPFVKEKIYERTHAFCGRKRVHRRHAG